MRSTREYEKRILEEIRALPEEVLPKILRLIAFVREEFLLPSKQAAQPKAGSETSHKRTRQLLEPLKATGPRSSSQSGKIVCELLVCTDARLLEFRRLEGIEGLNPEAAGGSY